jgi:hypothetical protein
MTIGNDLGSRLDSWMRQDAHLPDDLAEVLAKLAETPQRRHRWSISKTELKWRTRSMLSATRVASFVTIFAPGASTALVLTPADDGDQTLAPAAEVPTLEDMARVTWTGTQSRDDPTSGTATRTEYGELVEGHVSAFQIDASDERLSGTAAFTVNSRYLEPGDGQYPASVLVARVVLEADDGTWEGTYVGTDYPGTPDQEGQYILQGTGPYEGLTAVMTVYGSKTAGLVFPGSLPETP